MDLEAIRTRPRRPPINVMAMVNKFDSQERSTSPDQARPLDFHMRLSKSKSENELQRMSACGDDWVKLEHPKLDEKTTTVVPAGTKGSRTPPKPPARRKKFLAETAPAEQTLVTHASKAPMVPHQVDSTLSSPSIKTIEVSEVRRVPPRPPPPCLKPTRRWSPRQVRKDAGHFSTESPFPAVSMDIDPMSSIRSQDTIKYLPSKEPGADPRRSSVVSEASSLTDSYDETSQYKSSASSLVTESPGKILSCSLCMLLWRGGQVQTARRVYVAL